MKVTLFVPVRNEIEGLKQILPRIDPAWCDEMLFVDGDSTDGTYEYLVEKGFTVHRQREKGVKAAFWEGFNLASGDVIIPFSPDGNSIPEDIPKLIEGIRAGSDIVVASRYLGEARSEDDDVASALANRLFTGLINLLYGTRLTDGIGMYKAFYKRHLFELGIDQHPNEHSEIMLLTRGSRYGLKITEIPSPEPARIGDHACRAHPGALGKYKTALILLRSILRDAVFYRPRKRTSPQS